MKQAKTSVAPEDTIATRLGPQPFGETREPRDTRETGQTTRNARDHRREPKLGLFDEPVGPDYRRARESGADEPVGSGQGLSDTRPDSTPGEAPAVTTSEPSTEQRLIEALQQRGKCSPGDLARARKLTEESADPLRLMLVRLGLVSERDMAAAAAEVLSIPLIGADDYPETPVAEADLSLRFLKDAKVVPLFETEQALGIAVADPLDSFTTQALQMATGKEIDLKVGLPTEIQAVLERLYEQPSDDDAEAEAEAQAELGNFSEEDIEHLRDLASEAPVIRMVNQILQRAVESRASDVHIEPFADQLKVRYRIDGILKEADSPPVSSTAAVISRVKIMAKLNIAERRLPQDGRIPQRIQGKELDLRVSTVPTMFGESVVMRLLDKESVRFDFDALGFDGLPRERMLKVLDQPYGIFLVTGPTGSGKSTTLYTALSRLNTEDRKIITVEDPVEYQVPGINQIPVKSSIGMTFAGALRAIVRQDPDIIMVGEMRDLETARIAVQSALTGHVVISTLHTNDAPSGVTRLLDMGVEDYLLTSTINGILAQRLVRRLCPNCRASYRAQPELAGRFAHIKGLSGVVDLHRAVGCDQCNGTGYRGRLVISEVLLMSEALRQAILAHATATEIKRIAIDEGMETMYQDGLRKALDGRTTIEEVLRVAEVD
ncbi:type II secretion system ATPase GspE [Halochromatium glycolicum]|uniref:Type II secretion system protein E n=1 Tax=Halochromatium glycolicum TaxID=85075 RepID=A0AAJ0U5N1_9GAMM|nr:type II secretion system ATPase GspE [Halochromatium glycolicum]MBK1705583.1 type II secretion system protein GspE [Halochromatium glycolicum]